MDFDWQVLMEMRHNGKWGCRHKFLIRTTNEVRAENIARMAAIKEFPEYTSHRVVNVACAEAHKQFMWHTVIIIEAQRIAEGRSFR